MHELILQLIWLQASDVQSLMSPQAGWLEEMVMTGNSSKSSLNECGK